MNRRDFLKLSAGAGAMTLMPGCLLAAPEPKRKKLNFVFILIDDMGWTDPGCYGSTFYETPNIDKLAAEGMRFTNAYAASPVCSPTRASIMTGKYPARLGITQWIGAPDKPVKYVHNMPTEEPTIAEALRQAGYTTAFIGKWHLGNKPYYPEHQGFDINIAGNRKGHPHDGYFSPYNLENLDDGPKGEYLTDRLTDECLEFLDENSDKPFLLYLSYYAVHTPMQAKKDLIDKYTSKAEKLPPSDGPHYLAEGDNIMTNQVQDHPVYAAMVQSTDESIGRLMNKLEALGLAGNTAVIFMSDNGGLSTRKSKNIPTSNLPLRAGKGWLYEGGIRVPMTIKWPGRVKPPSVCNEPVTSTDFYPTMLQMANLPLRPNQHIDGLSLVPLLTGTGKFDRDAIYWHYPHYHGSGSRPGGAVRAGNYKLIEFYEDNRVELYNLKNDISEKRNLAEKMPQKTAQLKKMLRSWRESVRARMPKPKPG
ncbi:MAG: sulfatase-like hydrolase/transferase [Planctomycetota bacterium]|nr:MAG: sulfatase-like hydrolase/transferase [Planctomycetota bacterium]